MTGPGRIPAGLLIVPATLVACGAAYLAWGDSMFSPGRLRDVAGDGPPRGGVRTHAELESNCAACHAPWSSGATMESLCLDCHVEVRSQISAGLPLHGRLSDATHCRKCHTEHRGPTATITDFTHFDHDLTAFPLTGMHRQAACAGCHKNDSYRETPRSCVACHAEPPVHRGRFGVDCARCHSTATWKEGALPAEFHKFPIRHGGGKNRGECATCHPATGVYRSYTCYGCHRHDPAKTAEKHLKWNIADLESCAKCHPTGRKRADQPPKEKRDDE